MDLEELLADPAYDLPVPPDGMHQVRRRAKRIQRRRQLAVTVPVVAAVVAAASLIGGPSRSAVLYGDRNGMPEPTLSPEPIPSRGPANQQLQTFCILPDGGALPGQTDVIGPTGDPVENCRRFWRYARHTEPPSLVAYQNKWGSVIVQIKSAPLPADAVALPVGVVQDPEMILIEETLVDIIGMGPGHCRTKSEAVADASSAITKVGLRDWPVRVDDSRTDATQKQCWGYAPNGRRHDVQVVAGEADVEYPAVLEQIAKPLRASLAHCWSRATALAQVHSAVEHSSLKPEFKAGVDIRNVDDPSARCTTIHLGGGGGIELTLRGPA